MTKKHIIPIIFTLFFVVIAGCSKTEQNYQINNNINDSQAIKDSQEQNENTSNQIDVIGPESLETDIDTSNWCTAEPTIADNGAKMNPINKEKYKSKEFVHIGFLGELFTADDCGASRVQYLFGTDYKDGLKIWVFPDIPKPFIVTLKDIGFTCTDDNVLVNRCNEWQIDKDVSVSNLLKLKPFYQYIQLSDCINCG